MPEFKGNNTTTEFLTKYIFDRLAHMPARAISAAPAASSTRSASRISESHVARASYEAPLVVKRVAFAVPGDLATPTGGYAYDRRMIAELQKLGWQVDVIDLGDGFPRPSAATKAAARDKLAAVPKDCPIVVDGLAFGVLPEAANELRERNPLLALVHHPLALETGLSPADAEALKTSERDALAAARGVVVTSPSTAHAADRRLRRSARDHHRGASRHRSRRAGEGQQRRHRAAALGRRGRAAQGLSTC